EADLALQRFRASVYRRYNDFVVFHALLLQKFPYRMVPALPPKRMLGADREFIEARRRALRRFINLVARHPPFSEDEDFLPADIQTQFAVSRELVRSVYNSFYKLRDRAERMAARAIDNAADLLTFGKELRQAAPRLTAGVGGASGFGAGRMRFPSSPCSDLSTGLTPRRRGGEFRQKPRFPHTALAGSAEAISLLSGALGSDTTPLPSWAALNSSTWGSLKQALKGLSVEFAVLADKAAQQGKQEEDAVVEKLNLFLDLLQSYKDLCERHEKGVLHKHQRALHKYSLMKRQMSAAVHSHEPESVEQLESRIVEVPRHGGILGGIVEQENAIQTMELRNHFSLFCLHQETQLVHAYLPLTSHILGAFVSSQIQGHKEMSKVWNDLKPKLHCLFSGPASALTPPRSPRDGLSPH
ncbi:Sorting nexin-8, partial [Myotis davidii]